MSVESLSFKLNIDDIISRIIKDYIRNISELIPFCFDANYRLLKIHLLIKDLLILLYQNESRNSSRKTNIAKKQRDEKVKLGHRIISQSIYNLINISYI